MKNVSFSEVDNQVLLSFSLASQMTDDICRSSEGKGGEGGKEEDGEEKKKR